MKSAVILLVLLCTTVAFADSPTTRPARPRIYSDGTPLPVLQASGPVRVASYIRPYAPKGDPHARFRNRHTYLFPSGSPYLYGFWFGCHGIPNGWSICGPVSGW